MINTLKKYSIATLVALVVGGCSGDSEFTSEITPIVKESKTLVIGESVEVNPGDTLSPNNDETKIDVEHIIGSEKKRVTLLQGEATLIYGNYNTEEIN